MLFKIKSNPLKLEKNEAQHYVIVQFSVGKMDFTLNQL